MSGTTSSEIFSILGSLTNGDCVYIMMVQMVEYPGIHKSYLCVYFRNRRSDKTRHHDIVVIP